MLSLLLLFLVSLRCVKSLVIVNLGGGLEVKIPPQCDSECANIASYFPAVNCTEAEQISLHDCQECFIKYNGAVNAAEDYADTVELVENIVSSCNANGASISGIPITTFSTYPAFTPWAGPGGAIITGATSSTSTPATTTSMSPASSASTTATGGNSSAGVTSSGERAAVAGLGSWAIAGLLCWLLLW